MRPFSKEALFIFSKKPAVLVSVYALIAIVASCQSLIATRYSPKAGWPTLYNNYVIFKTSFLNLCSQQNLYLAYPSTYYDLYKYSPSFALFMAPFSVMPDWLGLIVWNLLNALLLATSVLKLPAIPDRFRAPALWLLVFEALTSVQNSQSNALIAGLILWAFYFITVRRLALATLLIVIAVFIKPFCLVCFCLFLFYPDKLRAISWTILWALVAALLPLLVNTPEQLILQYKNWGELLAWDHDVSTGLSVQGWLQTWFNFAPPKNAILATGTLLLLLPLTQFRKYADSQFRAFYLAALLIWMVIMNHKAESPTFVIAFAGILIWYYNTARSAASVSLLIISFILISLSPGDLMPVYMREHLVKPYVLKVVPCIGVFGMLIASMMLSRKTIRRH